MLQGPIRQGPVTFRCEVPGEPGVSYVFTDAVPLVWTLAVVAATLAAVTVLWFWALHRPRTRDQPVPA